jgi:hypothetical protein
MVPPFVLHMALNHLGFAPISNAAFIANVTPIPNVIPASSHGERTPLQA